MGWWEVEVGVGGRSHGVILLNTSTKNSCMIIHF